MGTSATRATSLPLASFIAKRGKKMHANLQEISIANMFIGKEIANLMTKALKSNAIWRIRLSNCQIRDQEVLAIIDALRLNQSLTEIHLEKIGLGEHVAILLADALQKKRNLRKVNLSGNQITENIAIQVVSRIIKSNKQLAESNFNLHGIPA